MFLTIILWVVITAVTIYYFLVRPLFHWRNKGIPQGDPGYSLRDTLFIFMGRKYVISIIDKAYRKKPSSRYCGIYLFKTPILIIKDPQLLKQVMIEYFGHFTNRGNFFPEEADSMWSNGLIQLKGAKWKRVRPAITPLFTSGKLKIQFETIIDSAENFIKFFIEKEDNTIELDIKDAMSRYSNDIIAFIIFGINMDSMRNPDNKFYLMAKEVADANSSRSLNFIQSCFVLPLPLIKLFGIKLFSNEVNNFFRNIINEVVKSKIQEGNFRPDLINIFLEAGKNMRNDPEAFLPQVLLFLFGGIGVNSGLLSFICYELALNESVQDKLRYEIMETKNNSGGRLTYDSLLKMKYMDMVISECMRKYPVVPSSDRTCIKTCIIHPSDPDEKPLVIEKGTLLWIPIFSLHRDPKLFENPDLFDPERFNLEKKHEIDPYSFMPFGLGPRSCIGSRFSLLSIKAVLFHLLSNFELSPTKKTQVPLQFRKKALLLLESAEKVFLELRRLKQ